MSGRLEIRHWIRLGHPAYAVALSDDGQYIAVGSEQGVAVFNATGRRMFTHSPSATPLPVHQLAAVPDLSRLYVGARQGWLIRLDLERGEKAFSAEAQSLYQADSDLHTLSLSANDRFVALGHLSPALTLLQTDGHLLWRRHPDDGNATEGQLWAVALDTDGATLYVGSAGMGTNRLAALEARSGSPVAHRYLEAEARATALAVLPGGKGVAVVLAQDIYTVRLVAYDPGLTDLLWERTFDEPITALAADRQQPLLAVGVGYEGHVRVIDAQYGRVLAAQQTKSVVNGLALAQGRTLAAVTQDGNLVLMRYVPEEFRL